LPERKFSMLDAKLTGNEHGVHMPRYGVY
jgi:hypothetical protein